MSLFGAGNDDDSVGSGVNDYAAQTYEFFDRVWHWMDPFTVINAKNRRAVEACILIEAGQTVDESATADEAVRDEKMRVAYTRLLREIGHERFDSEQVQNDMLLQLKGKQTTTFTGKSLWRQQKDARKCVRSLAGEMPGAANFHSIPSGNSLRDAMKTLICKKFARRKGAKKAYDNVMDAWDDVPLGWWLEHNSVVYLLALMVHRQSPTIINAAANAKGGVTRNEQRDASAALVTQERRVESVKRHQRLQSSKQSSSAELAKQSSADLALEKTYKSARVEGMKGVAMKHILTAAEMKLKMMNDNRAFYVAAAADTASGEAELNNKIKRVIDNLPETFEDLTGEKEDDNVDE